MKYWTHTVWLWLLVTTAAQAQVREATCYEIPTDERLRVEVYNRLGQKTLVEQYVQGALETVTALTYDSLGRCVRSVRTDVQADPPWDYIEEWSYDDQGRETFWLWGNNRTGRWGSTLRLYDAQGRLAEQRHFLKNGQLDYTLRMAYEQRGDTLDEWAYNVPADTVMLATVLSYHERKIGKPSQPRHTQYFDADGVLQHEYRYKYDTKGRVLEEAFHLADGEVLMSYHSYDAAGRRIRTRERAGNDVSVWTYRYNARGDLVEERLKDFLGILRGERWTYKYW